MEKILWNTPTGLGVTHVSDDITDVQAHATMLQQSVCAGNTVLGIGEFDVPQDALSFDEVSFNHDTNALFTDIEKVKETTKKRLRAERKPILERLDIEFMRALELNASVAEIVQEKQRLRDITTTVDAVGTIPELRALRCQ
jgi:hypothetical protein